jgi:aerobic carbon-monoxide dehydrogenase large subunit
VTTRVIGEPLACREHPRLVTGRGRFAADALPGAAVMAFVRSPYAHARIGLVDLSTALATPGILAAWDVASIPVANRHLPGQPPDLANLPRPLLAAGEAKYQGEAVVALVAESAAQAADVAESITVDYRPLDATADVAQGELLFESRLGYGDAEAAFRDAPVRVRRALRLGRVTGASMEPRAVAAQPAGEGLVVFASTQWTYGVRDAIARAIDMPRDVITVISGDVGGAFGGKGFPYPEDVLVAVAARALNRPVRWSATRSEETASSAQAHGMWFEVEAAADSDGRLRGLRARFLHNVGAYTAALGAQAENLAGHMLSLYDFPALDVRVEFRLTNTAPTRFIRGGGRPVGNLAVERAMDALADEVGLDRLEVRRRNLVSTLPHTPGLRIAGSDIVLDGADYRGIVEAVAAALPSSGEPGVGEGFACGVESSGIGRPELLGMQLGKDGTLTVRLPSTPQGQCHETAFAQIAAERFGWPLERVRVLAGDTRLLATGNLTAASRSAIEMGNGTAVAARALRRRVLEVAAERLEASLDDLELLPGGVRVRGTDRCASLDALGDVDVVVSYQPERPRSWGPNVHGARVRVDPETGSVSLLDYVIAHDAGPKINPRVVEGQIQGGFVHGLGYTLFEALPFREDGSLAGTTFLDYLVPSAAEVPIQPRLIDFESLSTQNAEGFRGVGEAGTIPAPAAIISAIELALRTLRAGACVDWLPVTPESIVDAAAAARLRRD